MKPGFTKRSDSAERLSQVAAIARQGWSFAAAYRDLSRHPVDVESAKRAFAAALGAREQRFLDGLDRLVWPNPASPSRRLLEVAGAEHGDVQVLVRERGLDEALGSLRDNGVYVSYEESLGRVAARRGSVTLDLRPEHFANPRVDPEFLVSTSGTRSEGTLAQSNFAYIRRKAAGHALRLEVWGVRGAPTASWIPAFPGGGVGSILKYIGAGNTPERWFSQVNLSMPGVARHKHLANRAVVAASVLTRGGLPRPRYVPATNPDPPLEWLQGALARSGRALCTGYASSWTHLALVAEQRGISLAGAVISLGGEPATTAKVLAVEATGARVLNNYGSVPEGNLAVSCPYTVRDEYLHLQEHDHAVVTRQRPAPDGSEVSALCWTTLAPDSPRVLLNVENDDVGELHHDQSCDCLFGSLGMTTRLSKPRGISKVVAGGSTMPGHLLQRLAEDALPARFGGGPTDYQFVEQEQDGMTSLAVRVDPRLGPLNEADVLTVIRQVLSKSEAGLLCDAVWSAGLRIERATALSARSGKVMAFERLQPLSGELA